MSLSIFFGTTTFKIYEKASLFKSLSNFFAFVSEYFGKRLMHINSLKLNNLILYVHSKGQLISKGLCGILYCPKKWTKKFDFTTYYSVCQLIKLIQVASNSELKSFVYCNAPRSNITNILLSENSQAVFNFRIAWNDLLFFEIVPSHCFGASEASKIDCFKN